MRSFLGFKDSIFSFNFNIMIELGRGCDCLML